MLALRGSEALKAKLARLQARVEGKAEDRLRERATAVLEELTLNTPQWSGDTASSWVVNITGSYVKSYSNRKVTPWNQIGTPFFRGDKEAYYHANRESLDALINLKWNSKISIINTSPTAGRLDSGKILESGLRPGNYIPGDVLAMTHTQFKFQFLRKR